MKLKALHIPEQWLTTLHLELLATLQHDRQHASSWWGDHASTQIGLETGLSKSFLIGVTLPAEDLIMMTGLVSTGNGN